VTVEQCGADVVLSILDAGEGIPRTDRVRIFDKFQRLDGGQELPGLGLGLSIVRGLVTACGGEIRVEDAPGGGAAIRIRLRAAQPAMREAV
jgi:two-component system sensor histidine kinase KdpD